MNNSISEKAKSWDKLNKHFNGFLDLYINHYSTLVNARDNRLIVEKIQERIKLYSTIDSEESKYNFAILNELLKTTKHSGSKNA